MTKVLIRYGLLLFTFLSAVIAINEMYAMGGSRWNVLGFSVLFTAGLGFMLKFENVIE